MEVYEREGSVLREARQSRGWTQADLARRVGRSVASVSEIEHGKRRPPRAFAERLVSALGLGESLWPADDAVVRGGCGVPGCLDPECQVAYGLCHCGCGERTSLTRDSTR